MLMEHAASSSTKQSTTVVPTLKNEFGGGEQETGPHDPVVVGSG